MFSLLTTHQLWYNQEDTFDLHALRSEHLRSERSTLLIIANSRRRIQSFADSVIDERLREGIVLSGFWKRKYLL